MNTNKLLRHINAVRSLRLLARGQVMSRADIAREMGVTRATIGYAIAALADAGLIIEGADAATEARKGRPGIGVRLNPDGAYFVGIDIGTKVVTTVLVNLAMAVVARKVEPTGPDFRALEPIVARLLPTAREVVRGAGVDVTRLEGVGVSVPGIVGRAGQVVNAPFLEWRDFPLRETLVGSCPEKWPIVVCNDAFAFANAERAALEDTASRDLFLMLLAEGIGGAIVDDGRVFAGAHGCAGEIGHTQITANGHTAPFEALAGAKAFAAFLAPNQAVSDGVAALLERQADPDVAEALDDWAEAMAVGLANVIHLLDPGRVILGGPIADLHPTRHARIDQRLEELLLPGFSRPGISVASAGADGAAIGAAATIREQMFVLPDLDPSPSP